MLKKQNHSLHTQQEAGEYDKDLENEMDEANQRRRYFEVVIRQPKCRSGALF
jgi:hypothetical protein